MLLDSKYITMFNFIAGGGAHFELCQRRPGQQAVVKARTPAKHSSRLRLHIPVPDNGSSEGAR
jgi:hypothetical protein